ncbi:MAG: hypothetical protein L0Z55_08770 [Planctomycetes bacterium]|nr:hypothetical protein [Planctomycetota bacterium]
METARSAPAGAKALALVRDAEPDSVAIDVAAARRGDRGAFAALHARFAPMVHAILLARVPPREADDLVQDVFVAALDRLAALRLDAAFGAWLAAIARNRAADYHRQSAKEHELT